MKIWVGLVAAAGIAISAGTACAQGIYPRGGYGVASDLDGPYADEPYSQRPYADVPPYAALPPEGPRPLPPRIYGPRYGERSYDERSYDGPGYAPAVLPPTAVYGILRERGYSPLGIPQQRGFVYTISVISPDGDDGRLVIDARSGRILRFLPAYRLGDRMNQEITVSYGPAGAPPIAAPNGLPRPPVANPKLASRSPTVPLPKPMPARAVATPRAASHAESSRGTCVETGRCAGIDPAAAGRRSAGPGFTTRRDRGPAGCDINDDTDGGHRRRRTCRRCRDWNNSAIKNAPVLPGRFV